MKLRQARQVSNTAATETAPCKASLTGNPNFNDSAILKTDSPNAAEPGISGNVSSISFDIAKPLLR